MSYPAPRREQQPARKDPLTSLPDPFEDQTPPRMKQYAPYPTVLAELVKKLHYREGWHFSLEDIERDPASTHGSSAGGLTLIGITGDYDGPGHTYRGAMDAYHPNRPRPVYFYFPVPAATYNEQSWRRWLFERILDVERHEAMEHFQIGDERPYSPNHGPGNDPYYITELSTDEAKRTSFRGVVKEESR